MTVEELLKPRFEVIADYPNSSVKVGDIISQKPISYRVNANDSSSYTFEFLEKYPHLFKKLEWFEKRQENELPKFINYGWEGREKVPVTINDFEQGFTWLNSERQYLCHAIPVFE